VTRAFRSLRNRSVLALFAARLISLLGNGIAAVALVFAVLDLHGSSATTVGVVLTARMLSQITFVVLGGVIADRLPKRVVMVGADIGAGIVQALVAAIVLTGHATALRLAGLAILNGAAAALFEPAARSVMPRLVAGDDLQAANALLRLSQRGGSIAGAVLAGVFVVTVGPGATIAIDAATFITSAVLLLLMRIPPGEPAPAGPSLLRQARDGWREFTSRSWVWAMVLQLTVVNMVLAGGFYVLGPVVADRALGGAAAWSAVLTAQAVGFVVGSVVAIRFRPRYPIRAAVVVILGFPLSLLTLGMEAPVPVIALAAFLGGACIDIFDVLFETALQQQVPAAALSRVMSYDALGSLAFVPLGLAVSGPVAAAIGVRPTLVWAGVVIVATCPVILLVPSIRAVRAPAQNDPPADHEVMAPAGAEAV
jgi:predicted MFS family arabinose efflux permease